MTTGEQPGRETDFEGFEKGKEAARTLVAVAETGGRAVREVCVCVCVCAPCCVPMSACAREKLILVCVRGCFRTLRLRRDIHFVDVWMHFSGGWRGCVLGVCVCVRPMGSRERQDIPFSLSLSPCGWEMTSQFHLLKLRHLQ